MTTEEKEFQEKAWTPGERQCGGYTMLRAQTRKHRHLGSAVQKRAPGVGRCPGSGDRSACRLGRRSRRSSPGSRGPPPSVLQPRIRFISGLCVCVCGGCVSRDKETPRGCSPGTPSGGDGGLRSLGSPRGAGVQKRRCLSLGSNPACATDSLRRARRRRARLHPFAKRALRARP